MLILLTDGVSNIDQSRTVPEALAAKNRGITIFAVGITNSVNQEEIRDISTNPQQLDSNYFLTADFNSLDGISETLIKSACRPSYGMSMLYSSIVPYVNQILVIECTLILNSFSSVYKNRIYTV